MRDIEKKESAVSTTSSQILHLLGQCLTWHFLDSFNVPEQAFPPKAGDGFVQALDRD